MYTWIYTCNGSLDLLCTACTMMRLNDMQHVAFRGSFNLIRVSFNFIKMQQVACRVSFNLIKMQQAAFRMSLNLIRVSFNLVLQSQSNWPLFNGTWLKRRRELDNRICRNKTNLSLGCLHFGDLFLYLFDVLEQLVLWIYMYI